MPEASDFFGMDFGSKSVATQAAPVAPAVAPPQKGMIQSAMEFFGMDFAAKDKPQVRKVQPNVTDGNWDEINKKYAAGQAERTSARLTLLNAELAKERDPKNIDTLKREISRIAKGYNG